MKTFGLIFIFCFWSGVAWGAQDGHSHQENAHAHEDGHEHEHSEKENPHENHEDHGQHEEENGFQLSQAAVKTFALQFTDIKGEGPWAIPATALLYAGTEVNVYRLREGFYKRIDLQIMKKNKNEVTLRSQELQRGDKVVTVGTGFVRIAELAATGGIAHGHSH